MINLIGDKSCIFFPFCSVGYIGTFCTIKKVKFYRGELHFRGKVKCLKRNLKILKSGSFNLAVNLQIHSVGNLVLTLFIIFCCSSYFAVHDLVRIFHFCSGAAETMGQEATPP